MKTRHSKILEYITEHGKTEVSSTVRQASGFHSHHPQRPGLSGRTRHAKTRAGFAVPNDPGDIFYRMAFHADKNTYRQNCRCLHREWRNCHDRIRLHCTLLAEELAPHQEECDHRHQLCLPGGICPFLLKYPAHSPGRNPADAQPVSGRATDPAGRGSFFM